MPKPQLMHIDMDAFFASVEIARRPNIKGLPVCIGSPVLRRGVVSAASYEARAFGIRAGTPIYQAKELCPHAIFIPPDFSLYSKVARKVEEILISVTPEVEHLSLDEAYVHLRGLENRFPDLKSIALHIKKRIAEECNGITCSIGISHSRASAKAASDYDKPNGYVEVHDPVPFLASLELKAIPGIGHATLNKLHSMGIFSVRQAQEVSCSTLQDFFGKESGRYLYSIVRGIDSSHVESRRIPPKSVSHATTLNYNTTNPKTLLPIMASICDRLCHVLKKEGFFAKTLGVTIRYSNFQTDHKQRTLTVPMRSARKILPEVERLFFDMLIRGRPIRLIGIALTNFIETPKELNLLTYKEEEKEERLITGIEDIRKDYGRESIYFGATIPEEDISPRF